MKSRIMWEIHDAIVFSIEPSEKEELKELATDLMTNMNYYFLNVPLKVEWEFSDTNWYEMKGE